MKKYRVNVNGTVYEVELEEITDAAPAAAAPVSAPAAAPAAAPAGGEKVGRTGRRNPPDTARQIDREILGPTAVAAEQGEDEADTEQDADAPRTGQSGDVLREVEGQR